MDCYGGEIAIVKKLVELNRTGHGSNKDNDLIEDEPIEQVTELAVLFFLLELDVELLEPVQRQLGLIVNDYFERLLLFCPAVLYFVHKLATEWSNFFG